MSDFRAALLGWIDRATAFATSSRLLANGAEVRATLDSVRARAAALDRPLRAVLVGGTGVGKSSILNAIAGRDIGVASRRRPTTTEPTAYVHSTHAAEAAEFAPGMRAVTHDEEALRHLLLVDLPDMDSRATEHRALVDRILPLSDQVIWVVDPDKYNDGLLHRDYLSREARVRERFVVVFNKVDAVGPAELKLCLEGLNASLQGDHIDAPQMFAISAINPNTDAGFAAFSEFLRTKFTEKYVRELKAANVFRALHTVGTDVAADLGLPARLDQVRAEEAALSGRQEEFLRWLRLQLGPDVFSPELVRGIRDRFRDRFASLLPGPVGLVAEWRFRPAAVRDWRELAGLVRAEAGAAAGQKVHSRVWNDASDTAAFFRRLPAAVRPAPPPGEEAFSKMRDEALMKLEEELSREHEGERFRGKGKVAQHLLPATAAGGCGAATAAFAGELAAAGALSGMVAATAFVPIGLYAIESALARRDVSRAAREVAEKAAEHFRTSLDAIYRRVVTIPLMEAFARIRDEYSGWRALQAELASLER